MRQKRKERSLRKQGPRIKRGPLHAELQELLQQRKDSQVLRLLLQHWQELSYNEIQEIVRGRKWEIDLSRRYPSNNPRDRAVAVLAAAYQDNPFAIKGDREFFWEWLDEETRNRLLLKTYPEGNVLHFESPTIIERYLSRENIRFMLFLTNAQGQTPLHVRYGEKEFLEFIGRHLNQKQIVRLVTKKDAEGWTPIHEAIEGNGDLQPFLEFLTKHLRPPEIRGALNVANKEMKTPLLLAVHSQQRLQEMLSFITSLFPKPKDRKILILSDGGNMLHELAFTGRKPEVNFFHYLTEQEIEEMMLQTNYQGAYPIETAIWMDKEITEYIFDIIKRIPSLAHHPLLIKRIVPAALSTNRVAFERVKEFLEEILPVEKVEEHIKEGILEGLRKGQHVNPERILPLMKEYLNKQDIRRILLSKSSLLIFFTPRHFKMLAQVIEEKFLPEEIGRILSSQNAQGTTLFHFAVEKGGLLPLLKLLEKHTPTEEIRKILKLEDKTGNTILHALSRTTQPEHIQALRTYFSTEELYEWIVKKKNSHGTSPLRYAANFSYLAPFMPIIEEYLASEPALLGRIKFLASDRRHEVEQLVPHILEKMKGEGDWRDILFGALFENLPHLQATFAYPDMLGKAGKWSRPKVWILAQTVGLQEEEKRKVDKLMAQLPKKERHTILRMLFSVDSRVWRRWVIEEGMNGLEGLAERVGMKYMRDMAGLKEKEVKRVLQNISRYYPEIMLAMMMWAPSLRSLEHGMGVFLEVFSESPEERKKRLWKELEAPEKLKRAWLQGYKKEVKYFPDPEQIDKTALRWAIENMKIELENKGWEEEIPLKPEFVDLAPAQQFAQLKKLKQLKDKHGILQKWIKEIEGILLQEDIPHEMDFELTQDFELLFKSGKGLSFNTCQAYDYFDHSKLGILGLVTHPWMALAVLKDKEGRLAARLKLMLFRTSEGYVVGWDNLYGFPEIKHLLKEKLESVLGEWREKSLIIDYGSIERLERIYGVLEPAGPFKAPIYLDLSWNSSTGLIFPPF